jgi:hypothetical protein
MYVGVDEGDGPGPEDDGKGEKGGIEGGRGRETSGPPPEDGEGEGNEPEEPSEGGGSKPPPGLLNAFPLFNLAWLFSLHFL